MSLIPHYNRNTNQPRRVGHLIIDHTRYIDLAVLHASFIQLPGHFTIQPRQVLLFLHQRISIQLLNLCRYPQDLFNQHFTIVSRKNRIRQMPGAFHQARLKHFNVIHRKKREGGMILTSPTVDSTRQRTTIIYNAMGRDSSVALSANLFDSGTKSTKVPCYPTDLWITLQRDVTSVTTLNRVKGAIYRNIRQK